MSTPTDNERQAIKDAALDAEMLAYAHRRDTRAFHSPLEGYGLVQIDQALLWDEIRKGRPTTPAYQSAHGVKIKKLAVELAAAAILLAAQAESLVE